MDVTEYVALENEKLRKENASLYRVVKHLRIARDYWQEQYFIQKTKNNYHDFCWAMLPSFVRRFAEWLTRT